MFFVICRYIRTRLENGLTHNSAINTSNLSKKQRTVQYVQGVQVYYCKNVYTVPGVESAPVGAPPGAGGRLRTHLLHNYS